MKKFLLLVVLVVFVLVFVVNDVVSLVGEL